MPPRLRSKRCKSKYGVNTISTVCVAMTATETLRKQQRFFCENCNREIFLSAKHCDECGGKIEWPKDLAKIIASWKKSAKK